MFRQRHRKCKRYRFHPINMEWKDKGEFDILVQELKYHPRWFYTYFCKILEKYYELLTYIRLTYSTFIECISAEKPCNFCQISIYFHVQQSITQNWRPFSSCPSSQVHILGVIATHMYVSCINSHSWNVWLGRPKMAPVSIHWSRSPLLLPKPTCKIIQSMSCKCVDNSIDFQLIKWIKIDER